MILRNWFGGDGEVEKSTEPDEQNVVAAPHTLWSNVQQQNDMIESVCTKKKCGERVMGRLGVERKWGVLMCFFALASSSECFLGDDGDRVLAEGTEGKTISYSPC